MSKSQAEITRRKEILEALASYQKRGAIADDVKSMAERLVEESDRGVVVILGSLIEDILLERLMRSFVALTPAQKKNLTRAGGLLSSFDDRINLAQAMGLIDDDLVELLQTIKAMRNACAHSRLDISFLTPELRAVLALLYEGENAETIMQTNHAMSLRIMFIIAYVFISAVLRGYSPEEATARGQRIMDRLIVEAQKELKKLKASREKRKKPQAKRPRSNPKGKARPHPHRSLRE